METAILPRLAGGAGGCTGRNVPQPHHILSPRNMSRLWDPEELTLKVLCPPFSKKEAKLIVALLVRVIKDK